MLKERGYYDEHGKANVALKQTIEQVADAVCRDGFSNIFFAGSGGSICMLMPFVEMLKKRTDITSYAEEAADLLAADYRQLTKDSLVVVVSKTGDAVEPMELVRECGRGESARCPLWATTRRRFIWNPLTKSGLTRT